MELQEGIKFDVTPTKEKSVTLTYQGALKDSATVKIVYGFGDDWQHTTEQTMEKTDDGFVAEIKMLDYGVFHFCFRNEVYEWDNNNSCNYTSEISDVAPVTTEEFTPSIAVDQEAISEVLTSLFERDVAKIEASGPIRSFKAEVERIEPIEIEEAITGVTEAAELTEELNAILEDDKEVTYDSISLMDQILEPIIEEISSLPEVGEVAIEEFSSELDSIELVEEESLYDETSNVEMFEEEDSTVDAVVDDVVDEIAGETSLVSLDDGFLVSNRTLGQFYMLKKRIKLAFLKLFVGVPKLIISSLLGDEN